MDRGPITLRIPRRWAKVGLVALVTTLIVAPSVAIAADRFTDVPDTNTFHDDITWLADAAVTLGCNPPDNDEYCPDDNVTRGQMAAFMRRLAENQVVDAATAIDAQSAAQADNAANSDLLDGLEANQLVRASFAENGGTIDGFTEGSFTSILSTSVEAPVDGVLLIWATVNAEWDIDSAADSNADLDTRIAVDGTGVGVVVDQEFADVPNGANSGESIALSVAAPVTAGTHTIDIQALRSGTSEIFIKARTLKTLFVPFGGDGDQGVLGVTSSGSSSGSSND